MGSSSVEDMITVMYRRVPGQNDVMTLGLDLEVESAVYNHEIQKKQDRGV